jgi:hypothetical protein
MVSRIVQAELRGGGSPRTVSPPPPQSSLLARSFPKCEFSGELAPPFATRQIPVHLFATEVHSLPAFPYVQQTDRGFYALQCLIDAIDLQLLCLAAQLLEMMLLKLWNLELTPSFHRPKLPRFVMGPSSCRDRRAVTYFFDTCGPPADKTKYARMAQQVREPTSSSSQDFRITEHPPTGIATDG